MTRCRAAEKVIDKLDDHFPLRVWQTGSGTQSNMNAKVIANRAIEMAGACSARKSPVHPTTMSTGRSPQRHLPHRDAHRRAEAIVHEVIPPSALREALAAKAEACRASSRSAGPTSWTPCRHPRSGSWRLGGQLDADLRRSPLRRGPARVGAGGTAVGTGLNTHPDRRAVAAAIAETTGLPFVSAPNKFAQLAAHDAVVAASGAFNTLAASLMKVANDVRWLGSGPAVALVNSRSRPTNPAPPSCPERSTRRKPAMTMVCCRVMGNHTAITIGGSQGNFGLNVQTDDDAQPPAQRAPAHGRLPRLPPQCVDGWADLAAIGDHLENSLMLVTALNNRIGYDMAAKIAKKAHEESTTLREAALALNALTEEQFDAWVRPEDMTRPRPDHFEKALSLANIAARCAAASSSTASASSSRASLRRSMGASRTMTSPLRALASREPSAVMASIWTPVVTRLRHPLNQFQMALRMTSGRRPRIHPRLPRLQRSRVRL